MGIWGKVIGGVTGFALGGPLGAVLGGLAGHVVDRIREDQADEQGRIGQGRFGAGFAQAQRQAAFATAVIVLSAKMAKADGRVSRDEVDAFKRIFVIPENETKAVGEIFNKAKADARGFEPYAEQIATLFRHEPRVMEELLGALFHIAMADGAFHPKEEAYLRRIAAIFGFSERDFARLRAIYVEGRAGAAGGPAAGEPDPYQVLELEHGATDEEVKATYRKLVRENHPDRLTAQGLPEEFVELANEKLAAINAAYDRIKRERGMT